MMTTDMQTRLSKSCSDAAVGYATAATEAYAEMTTKNSGVLGRADPLLGAGGGRGAAFLVPSPGRPPTQTAQDGPAGRHAFDAKSVVSSFESREHDDQFAARRAVLVVAEPRQHTAGACDVADGDDVHVRWRPPRRCSSRRRGERRCARRRQHHRGGIPVRFLQLPHQWRPRVDPYCREEARSAPASLASLSAAPVSSPAAISLWPWLPASFNA